MELAGVAGIGSDGVGLPRWAAITHRREALAANTDRRVALAR